MDWSTKFLKQLHLRKVYSVLATLLILLCLIAGWTHAIYKSGYIHCVRYMVSGTAQHAFQCGNYYFGVYGRGGYDVEKAEKYFAKTIELDPNTPDVWHQYARIAFLKGTYTVALERINKQIELHGDELMAAYYIRGLIYGYKKDFKSAEKDFEKYVDWNITNWASNNDLAWIYFSQGKFTEARNQAQIGLRYHPDNPWLLMMHAMATYNLGEPFLAEAELIKAKEAASKLSASDWDKAYPGNDPAIAPTGLREFRAAVDRNLELVHNNAFKP